MFSTREHLAKRTGPFGIGRASYLQSLVGEFQDTESEDSKEQVCFLIEKWVTVHV